MIRIRRGQAEAISRHGEADYPHECCGLLLGRFLDGGGKAVEEIYPISNAREEAAKRNRFLISSEEFAKGDAFARASGLEVVGFYHSHPDHPSAPSDYDREHAWPAYSYAIVSVEQGKAILLTSWVLKPDRTAFDSEEILEGE